MAQVKIELIFDNVDIKSLFDELRAVSSNPQVNPILIELLRQIKQKKKSNRP